LKENWDKAFSRITVAATGNRTDPPGETFGPRKQWSHEFIWMRSGSVKAKIGTKTLVGNPNTVFLVPPAVTDSYTYSKKERSLHSYIHFHLGKPPKGWPPPSPYRLPFFRQFPTDHVFFHLFRQVLTFSPLSDKRYQPILESTVGLMLRYFVFNEKLNTTESPIEPGLSSPVERALYWMKDRVMEKTLSEIRLTDMAGAAFTSPQNLCRLFKKDLEISPMECAKLLKVDYAGTLIERSTLTLKEISNLCKFENPFHFSRVYKEVFGMPPKTYRQGFRKNKSIRLGSLIFSRYRFQSMRVNNLLGLPAAEFKLLPKKYRAFLK